MQDYLQIFYFILGALFLLLCLYVVILLIKYIQTYNTTLKIETPEDVALNMTKQLS